MNRERWKRVEKILAAALDLPPDQQTRYLDSACGEDSELRREVEELLVIAPEASGFLGTPPIGEPAETAAEPAPPFTGDITQGSLIGSYRVERLLGAGGMGAVYLASRADDAYEQRVAIKILHPGFAGPSLTARFLAERQILAVLDHPNIARLLDGGATANGRPFLVMEYVEGVAIDRYCETHSLTVEERLAVFLKICAAVAFAHRNLVVHRDIKPSNILVTEDGSPKLLDFGIAKLLDTSAFPEMGELTQTGMRPMSPAYASPEQIGGRAITTASDVYSLGVVLFKLLTGRLPHDPLERAVAANARDGRPEPTRPSAAVTQDPSPGEDGDQTKRLKRRLEGDIDTIVLTALRDEPERRYGTVDELADDIERHLDGRTVNARPSTLAYRAATFVRRYRLPVAAAVIVAGLMIGSIVALAAQARRIAAERDRAEEMAEFTAGLFEVGWPARILDPVSSTREVLHRGVVWQGRELSNEPGLLSDQLAILARVYRSIDKPEAAKEMLLQSNRLKEEIYGADQPELIPGLNELASIYLAVGQPDDSEVLLERALTIGRSSRQVNQAELAATNALLGSIWWNRWVPEKATAHLRTALAITKRVRAPNHPEVAIRMANLADLLRVADPGSSEAEDLYRQALDIQMGLPGGEPGIWRTLEPLGLLYRDRHRLSQAAALFRQAIHEIEKTRTFEDSDRYRLHHSLGLVEWHRGNLATAEGFLRRCFSYEASGAPEWSSSSIKEFHLSLARLIFDLGRLQEAQTLWEESLTTYSTEIHREPLIEIPQYAALVEQRRGAWQAAEEMMLKTLAELGSAGDGDDPAIAPALARAARFFKGAGDLERAEPLVRRAIKIWSQGSGHQNPAYPMALCNLGATVMELGDGEEAEDLLLRARRLIEEQREFDPSPRKNEVLAQIQLARGDLLRRRGKTETAEMLWRECLRVLSSNPEGSIGANHRLLAIEAWLKLGEPERARTHAEVLIEQGWKWPPMLDQFR